MNIKIEPEIEAISNAFSEDFTKESYGKGISFADNYGYYINSIKIKRSRLPSFPLGVPVKLLADWDVEVKDCDMVIQVKRKIQ